MTRFVTLLLAASSLSCGSLCFGQGNVLSVEPAPAIKAKAGSSVDARLMLSMRPGYHVNSNTPSDPYLIALRLTWTPGVLEDPQVVFPAPRMEKYSFTEKPLSVFSGNFELLTKFKVPASASPGPAAVTGKLRYQACNDTMCLPPKSLDVALQVDIVK